MTEELPLEVQIRLIRAESRAEWLEYIFEHIQECPQMSAREFVTKYMLEDYINNSKVCGHPVDTKLLEYFRPSMGADVVYTKNYSLYPNCMKVCRPFSEKVDGVIPPNYRELGTCMTCGKIKWDEATENGSIVCTEYQENGARINCVCDDYEDVNTNDDVENNPI